MHYKIYSSLLCLTTCIREHMQNIFEFSLRLANSKSSIPDRYIRSTPIGIQVYKRIHSFSVIQIFNCSIFSSQNKFNRLQAIYCYLFQINKDKNTRTVMKCVFEIIRKESRLLFKKKEDKTKLNAWNAIMWLICFSQIRCSNNQMELSTILFKSIVQIVTRCNSPLILANPFGSNFAVPGTLACGTPIKSDSRARYLQNCTSSRRPIKYRKTTDSFD